MSAKLIKEKNVKEYVHESWRRQRPSSVHHRLTQVSSSFLRRLEGKVKSLIDEEVNKHYQGKTLK